MSVELLVAVALSQWVSLTLARYGIPNMAVYVLAGMLLGSIGYSHSQMTDALMRVVLLFLFFYAGVNVNMDAVRKYFREASLLTSLGVSLTAALVATLLTCLGVDPVASLIVGVTLANTATEAAVLMLHESRIDLAELRNLIVAASFMDDLLLVVLAALTQSAVFKAPLVHGVVTVVAHVAFLAMSFLLLIITPKFIGSLSWEGYVTFASALAFTTAFAASSLGISEYFGMYVAGLALSALKLKSDPTLSYSTKLYSLLDHFTTIGQVFHNAVLLRRYRDLPERCGVL
ncbi:MAG: cation:proton antiporter [Zestosphaera sp.]